MMGKGPGPIPQSRPVSHIPCPIKIFREAKKHTAISILPPEIKFVQKVLIHS